MLRITRKLSLAIAAAALGSSFPCGYNFGVTVNGGTGWHIEQFINETYFKRNGEYIRPSDADFIFAWCSGAFLVGEIIGGITGGIVGDKLGRKTGLLCNNVFLLIGVLLMGLCKACSSYEMLIAGRFIVGLNAGLSTCLVPMYLIEISPTNIRGAVGTIHYLMFTVSILVSQVLGLDGLLGNESRWPWLLVVPIIPSVFQMCILPLCPESPVYTFLNRDDERQATLGLYWLRDTTEVHEEFESMRGEYEQMRSRPSVTLKSMLAMGDFRRPLLIAGGIMMAQQFCGIGVVLFFSGKIFTSAGLTESSAKLATFGMSAVNIAGALISLLLVDKVGRKKLMLFGMCGMCFEMVLLFFCIQNKDITWISYVSIFLVVLFVGLFASGLGPIPSYFVCELSCQAARSYATSIVVSLKLILNFVVGIILFVLLKLMDSYVFIVFALTLGCFIAVTWLKLPETSGKTIYSINAKFRGRNYSED